VTLSRCVREAARGVAPGTAVALRPLAVTRLIPFFLLLAACAVDPADSTGEYANGQGDLNLWATPSDAVTVSHAISFQFGASGVRSYKCSLDGATPTVCRNGLAYGNVAYGTHTLEVIGYDAYGHFVGADSWDWTVTNFILDTPTAVLPDNNVPISWRTDGTVPTTLTCTFVYNGNSFPCHSGDVVASNRAADQEILRVTGPGVDVSRNFELPRVWSTHEEYGMTYVQANQWMTFYCIGPDWYGTQQCEWPGTWAHVRHHGGTITGLFGVTAGGYRTNTISIPQN
jgi:hypothetical protein